jgi:hypothetical protein
MTFFYDLNKRLAQLADKQDAQQLAEDTKAQAPRSKLAESMGVAEADYSAKKAAAGKDIGKPGKNFSKIAKGAAERYGSKEAGERVAGAVLNKLRQAKEDITDEGNAFTAALKATPKGGKFKVGGKEFTDNSDLEEGFKEMDAWMASREKEKGTGRYDKKKISTGTVYTRKPETFDDPETDSETTDGEPKRRGRPKGKDKGPERVTAKSYKYKAGRPTKTKEDLDSDGVMMTRPSNMSSEGINPSEYDQEGDMAKKDLKSLALGAKELHAILGDDQNLPEWVQSKITKALDYINSSNQYMHQEQGDMVKESTTDDLVTAAGILGNLVRRSNKGETIEPKELATQLRQAHKLLSQIMGGAPVDTLRPETKPVTEKAVSKSQQQAAGIALAAKRSGKKPAGKGAAAEMSKMPEKELEKFAKTKHKGLPKQVKKADEGKGDGNLANNAKPYDKVTQGDVVAGRLGKDEMGGKKKKEEKVDETTVSGSVATATTSGKSSSGGMQFGKGVYEGFNTQVESMITEGMNVSVNMSTDANGQASKNITVSAEGDDADQLAALLKMAGLHGQSSESCGTCGQASCGCEQTVDEAYGDTDETLNDPDWPTDTETLAADPNLRTYSGGLNGPKSTGQTTIPVVASQERRLHSMDETVELERNLFKTWKNYKG